MKLERIVHGLCCQTVGGNHVKLLNGIFYSNKMEKKLEGNVKQLKEFGLIRNN